MEFLEADNPEWGDIWEQLAEYDINDGDAMCLNGTHCWEYMGSTADHHHLRHMNHPRTGKSEFIYLERHKVAMLAWA